MYELLILILFANVLQIPQVQKLMSWAWGRLIQAKKVSAIKAKKYSRRAYYWVKR